MKPSAATGQAYPEGVQGTAESHHPIADTLLPQAHTVCDGATALLPDVHVVDAPPAVVQRLIGRMLLAGELLTTGLLRRHEYLDLGKCERQKVQILQ